MRGLAGLARLAVVAVSVGLGSVPSAAALAQTPVLDQRVGAAARKAITLTVYQQDLAQISERRRVRLAAGRNRVVLEEISRAMQPETLMIRAPGVRVVTQQPALEALTPRRLLEAARGGRVRLVRTHPQTGVEQSEDAVLLSVTDGVVLRLGTRIEIDPPGRIVLDDLPPGLATHPAVIAELDSAAAGEVDLTLRYLSGGLSWRADYVAELTPDGTHMTWRGTVTLTNASEVGFAGAAVRLVAGEVRRVSSAPTPEQPVRAMALAERATMAVTPPRALGDRYVYALAGTVDLPARTSRQVTLMPAASVPVHREYRFESLIDAGPGGPEELGPVSAEIVLVAENTAEAGLGRPLPAGIVRVYEPGGGYEPEGVAAAPIFTGEDRIDHTPAGAPLRLRLGRAFDVIASARRSVFERLSARSYETGQEITVRNAGDRAVTVRLIGHLPPGWRMLEESAAHEAETANRLAWSLHVPPSGTATLRYRVRITR
ncbi:MAG: hypothetical protein D6826_06860 [Alphaproteobacteria bacterium]|nr:MAG: hypothetical protein D6826_06860 [Alphaproteobacteria bacterium]